MPPRVARAHSGTDSYLFLTVDHGSVFGTVEYPVSKLSDVLGLPLQRAGRAPDDVETMLMAIMEYAAAHVRIGASDDEAWSIEFETDSVLLDNGVYANLDYEITNPPRPIPRRVSVTFDGIIEADSDHAALVIIDRRVGFGKLKTRMRKQFPFAAGATTQDLPIPADQLANDLVGAGKSMVSRSVRLLRRWQTRG